MSDQHNSSQGTETGFIETFRANFHEMFFGGFMEKLSDQEQTIFIGTILFMLLTVMWVMIRMRRARYRHTPKLAHHRLGARYLQEEEPEVENATPYIHRTRWALIGATITLIFCIAVFSHAKHIDQFIESLFS